MITYYYDELNQLTREDNEILNKTITYSYDAGGNILSKAEYSYTTGDLGTATSTISYGYEDSNWKDKLTSFNGKEITYDAIGNPLTYDGYTFTWEQGRQLLGINGNGKDISFKYNVDGIRTEKTVNGVTTKYHLAGDRVTFEDNGTDKIYYTYDSAGQLISMNLTSSSTPSINGEYYYIRNAQGDIIGLYDKNGTQVVSYTYDSWGKLISIDGSLKDSVGVKNPYRYRGYRYDNEIGLYYLQSRYYSPEWGRFINADAFAGQCGELLSHNMFIYSINNPVNMSDPSGFRPLFTANEETDEMREASFAAMRSAAKQSGGTIKTNNVVQAKLGNKGAPNSKDKLYNKDGSVKQERVYGPNGKPLLDTDWNHGGVGHVFPHTHEWKDGERQDGVPFHGAPPPQRSVSNTQISRWATAGITLYWVVSEGSRIVFPPRNLVPIP